VKDWECEKLVGLKAAGFGWLGIEGSVFDSRAWGGRSSIMRVLGREGQCDMSEDILLRS
jgi:hypothetical protein